MSPEGSSIVFHGVPALLRGCAEGFARRLETEVTRGRPFDCLITTDARLRRLNRDFRRKDAVTDVLSFPARRLGLKTPYLGDIAISLPRARAQALTFGHAVEKELEVLMLHGVLHLLGMDHESDDGSMRRAEKRWRTRFGLPAGLIERVRS